MSVNGRGNVTTNSDYFNQEYIRGLGYGLGLASATVISSIATPIIQEKAMQLIQKVSGMSKKIQIGWAVVSLSSICISVYRYFEKKESHPDEK